jgi:tRNA threonylcarbamoyladenosine biosynthesis protein TsaE
MLKKIFKTSSEKQTFNLGKKIARQLQGGEVLALTGDLGAGKTVLVKGIAAGLGVKNIVTSPTFVIMKVYNASRSGAAIKKLAHIDCYRVGEPELIEAIGAREYFGRPDAITLIEWAEKIKKIIPQYSIGIKIALKEGNKREIMISGSIDNIDLQMLDKY